MKLRQTMAFLTFKEFSYKSPTWRSKTLKIMHMHKCFAKLGFFMSSKHLEKAWTS